MPDCLIISAAANDYAAAITRLADSPVSVTACTTIERALNEYADQSILFGNPDMIAEVIPEMASIDWVQSTWAGITSLLTVGRRDYVLTGVKGVFGQQMSEYVLGYLLAFELKILERMSAQRERNWIDVFSGTLHGKHLCILGTGSIGRHIAQTAKHLGITVTGVSRSGAPSPEFDAVVTVAHLHSVLAETDYLVSVLPQTTATDGLIDQAALARLPAHSYFINVGRSNVIDDEALINALQNSELAGAALDVFDEEPVPPDSRLWDVPNLSITAHIAAISHPSVIVPIFLENYRRYTNKQPLKYTVDFDVGY